VILSHWEFGCLALLLMASLAWLNLGSPAGPDSQPEVVPSPPKGPGLAEWQAEAQQRIAALKGATLELLEQLPSEAPSGTESSEVLAKPGRWLLLRLQLAVAPDCQWWPAGLSLECQEFLALRDQGEDQPPLYLRLPLQVASRAVRQGSGELEVRVYVPDSCKSFELGYYGVPHLILGRTHSQEALVPRA